MPRSSPKANLKNLGPGPYAIKAIRNRGIPAANTQLGRAFKARVREYARDLGGEENLSLAQLQITNDNVWCDFLIATMDAELQSKVRLTRKGRPHPLIELRMRVADHRRRNYQLLGIKRVPKAVDWRNVIQEGSNGTAGTDPDPQQGSEMPASTENSLPTDTGETGESGEDSNND